MTAQPPGATVSEDGHYWWDENAQQWQLVEQGGAAGSAAQAASSTGATAAAAAPGADGSEPEAGAEAQADVAIEGQCLGGELSADEIAQILAQAGATLETS